MAASPDYKVYASDGEYVASCKYATDAAVLVSTYRDGCVKYRHRRDVWIEGKESHPAAESYDAAADTMERRVMEWRL